MNESNEPESSVNSQRSLFDKIFEHVKDNDYLIFYVVAFFLYALAFNSETSIGPISFKGQVDNHYQLLLVIIATGIFLIALLKHLKLNFQRKKLRENIDASLRNTQELNSIVQNISSSSDEYRQLLEPISSFADEYERQTRVRMRLVEWLRKYPQEDWVNRVITQEFMETYSPRYLESSQEKIFKADIKRYIEILAENIRRGEPYSAKNYGLQRNIDSTYPYRKALLSIKENILTSLKKAEELSDCVDASLRVLLPFLDSLIDDTGNQ